MGILRLYTDSGLINRVSENQLFNSPDYAYISEDSTSEDKQLWIGIEKSHLADALDATTTSIRIDEDFEGIFGEEIIAAIEDEVVLIQEVEGQYLTVIRGFLGTTKASHDASSLIYAAFDATNLNISSYAREGQGEADWYQFALTQEALDDATNYLYLGNMAADQTYTFWRRVSVPPGQSSSAFLNVAIVYRSTITVRV